MNTVEKAIALRDLYQAPEILRVVNVWDAISTKVVADLPETRAIATAGQCRARWQRTHSLPGGTGLPSFPSTGKL